MEIAGGSVDLGDVTCVAGAHPWDRATALVYDSDPACNGTLFFLARDTRAGDFSSSHPGGEPRDTMNPDPPCP